MDTKERKDPMERNDSERMEAKGEGKGNESWSSYRAVAASGRAVNLR